MRFPLPILMLASLLLSAAPAFAAVDTSPSSFLDVERARFTPPAFNEIDIAMGYYGQSRPVGVSFRRGLSAGSELQVSLGLYDSAQSNSGSTVELGLGWKHKLPSFGPVVSAIDASAFYGQAGSPVGYGAMLALPVTMDVRPGEITLAPRLLLPDLGNADRLSSATAGLQVGYLWPVYPYVTVMGALIPAYGYQTGFQAPIQLGVRLSPVPTVHIEIGVSTSGQPVAATPLNFASFSLAHVTLRYGY
ncbi:MAG TPA: hypothetical protein V6D47_04405 [Oscillatoriaceae cyanobacterium]